ncbi:MAG: DUF721 domain-containing protein [Fimbriimonadaceae bacterium]
MKKLQDTLKKALGREEILRMARAQRVMRRWPEIVGAAMAGRSAPDRYERGTVWVAVQGSAWAQELRMMRDRILGKLGELAADPTLFTDIRFGVRPFKPFSGSPLPDEWGGEGQGVMGSEKAVVEDRREELRGLSIREIADRRMEQWRLENGD